MGNGNDFPLEIGREVASCSPLLGTQSKTLDKIKQGNGQILCKHPKYLSYI